MYCKIGCGMYGLPQVAILASKLLKEQLSKHGYDKLDHTPGLFKHETRPVWFTLTVDNVGVKYIDKEHAGHIMETLKLYYKMEED